MKVPLACCLFARSLSLLFVLTLFSLPARAQGGYDRQTIAHLGLTLPVPRSYTSIPVQPGEKWKLLTWRAEPGRREKDRHPDSMPRLELVWIPRVSDIVLTGTGDAPVPGQEGSTPRRLSEEEMHPVNSIERYMDRIVDDYWLLADPEKEKGEADGFEITRYTLKPGEENRTEWQGWACGFRGKDVEMLLVGYAFGDDWKSHTKIWRHMARKLQLEEPEAKDLEKQKKYYAKHPEFIDPEFRLEQRSRLVRGWEADDSENYIYVYSTKDQPLVRTIMREMESIRKEYERLFPPLREIKTVSTVRICKDRAEYFAYGGPPGSGGYWNSRSEELVFFDYEDVKGEGKGSGKADTRIVLYHEAFHQYIHYSTGELPPHTWYNEGTGDFFSGARISGTKVKSIGTNPWRLEAIQRYIESDDITSWQSILQMEQPEFYAKAAIYYPQAWSMVYFLRKSPVVRRNEAWAKILPTYFNVLRDDYGARLEKLGESPGFAGRAEAGLNARKAALEAAFEGFNDAEYEAITEAWKKYTMGLRP